jgi:hypothetical protein
MGFFHQCQDGQNTAQQEVPMLHPRLQTELPCDNHFLQAVQKVHVNCRTYSEGDENIVFEGGKMTKSSNKITRKARAGIERVFIVSETFNGTRKLSEILADLIHAAYSKQEQNSTR